MEDIDQDLNSKLKRDPYAVQALLMRGQIRYVAIKDSGPLRFGEH